MYVRYIKEHKETSLYLTLGHIYEVLMNTDEDIMIDVLGYGKLGFRLELFELVNENTCEILYRQS